MCMINKIIPVSLALAETSLDAFDAIAKQSEVETKLAEPFEICTDESGSGFLSKSLLTGNIELAVELCLEQNRMADAIILALQGISFLRLTRRF